MLKPLAPREIVGATPDTPGSIGIGLKPSEISALETTVLHELRDPAQADGVQAGIVVTPGAILRHDMIAACGLFSQMIPGIVRRQFCAGSVTQVVCQADKCPLVVGAGPRSYFAGRVQVIPDRTRRCVEQVCFLPGQEVPSFGSIAGIA